MEKMEIKNAKKLVRMGEMIMAINFNKSVVQNIYACMNKKNITRQQLANMLGLEDFLLLGYFNLDISFTILLIKKIAKILNVSINVLLETTDSIQYTVFVDTSEQERYYKWLEDYRYTLRNQKVDFSGMSKKRTFDPNL